MYWLVSSSEIPEKEALGTEIYSPSSLCMDLTQSARGQSLSIQIKISHTPFVSQLY